GRHRRASARRHAVRPEPEPGGPAAVAAVALHLGSLAGVLLGASEQSLLVRSRLRADPGRRSRRLASAVPPEAGVPPAAPRGRPAIPLADLGLLRRPLLRTTATRLGLLVALAALAAISIWRATQLQASALSFLPHRSSTVLVLDQSKSVYLSGYKEIAGLLDAF